MKCSETVAEPGRWPRYHQCTRNSVVERNDRQYCKVHDPEQVALREAAAHKRWDEKLKREMAHYRLARLLAALAPIREALKDEPIVHALDAAIKEAS